MSTFLKCPAEVHALAAGILKEFPSHEPLLRAKLKIDLLFALAERDDAGNKKGVALKLGGRECLGIARRIKLKDRVMGRGDCEVSLDGDWWADASAEQQRALLDHELHHFVVELDGERVVTDDIGRPVVRMRKHDYEFGWFEVIAGRHGLHSMEVQQARRMMERSGKILLQTSFDFLSVEQTPVQSLPDQMKSEIVDEEMIAQCIEVIRSEQKASVALLQRRLRLGYTRAAKIMDLLEVRGLVGPSNGAEPREILLGEDCIAISAGGKSSGPVSLKKVKAVLATLAAGRARRARK